MAQIIDIKAAREAKEAKSAKLAFPTFRPASTRRVRLADGRTLVRMNAKERL